MTTRSNDSRSRGGLWTSPWRSSQPWTPRRSRLARATASMEWLVSRPTERSARSPSSASMRPVPVPMSSTRPSGPSPMASRMAASTVLAAACSDRSSSQIGAIRSKYSPAVSARRAHHCEPIAIGGEHRIGGIDRVQRGVHERTVGTGVHEAKTPRSPRGVWRRVRHRPAVAGGARRGAGTARGSR